MRGEEEKRERGDTKNGRTQQERGRRRAARRKRYIDRREDTTTDDDEEEEEERPHGRLTLVHNRDLADVPRGQVLVEGLGMVKH